MVKVLQTTIQCSQCRQPVRAQFLNVIDAQQNPQAKIALLSGRINTVECPHCGAVNSILTPLIYHDGEKQLLVAYVPMELGLSKDAQERAIGDLVRQLTAELPQGAFKGYMLQPRQALTMQGLIDQVLQADGITLEMLEAQRARVRLVERFIEADDEQLRALAEMHDSQIDARFFQTIALLVQRMLQEGKKEMAQHLVNIQNKLLSLTTFGRQLAERTQAQEALLQRVSEDLQALGENAQRVDFLELALKYADDDRALQALVGLARPAFDYGFFQEMQTRIGQAAAQDRPRLENLRERLLELTSMVDQQAQMAVQDAANLLQAIVNSDNPDEIIQSSLDLIDVTFMQVLAANLREAERRGDARATARLRDIYQRVLTTLQANMPPEVRFINEVLGAPSEDEAHQLVEQHIGEFGRDLLEVIDAIEEQVSQQQDPVMNDRLRYLRQRAASI